MQNGPSGSRRGSPHRYLPVLSWLLVVLVCVWTGRYFLTRLPLEHRRRVASFDRALRLIPKHYAGDVDEASLYEAAMDGMLRSLGDPYSGFLDARELEEASVQTEGEFGGVGIEVIPCERGAIVTDVLEGSPSEAAGLRCGDVIVGVDGCDGSEMAFMEFVSRIRGKSGTKVQLRIQRAGSSETENIELTRARITVRSVKWRRIEPDIGYFQIRQFDAHCAEQIRKGINELAGAGALKALVLDVRNNRGGLLKEAVDVCDLFLGEGAIVRVESRIEQERVTFRAKPETLVPAHVPIVVLVNGQSASAAEVMAAALQSHGRATLIGLRTVGKGAVNRIYSLPDGSGVVLTVGHYVAGSGVAVDGAGVEPDIEVGEVPPPPTDEDAEARERWLAQFRAAQEEQLQRAVEFLRTKMR